MKLGKPSKNNFYYFRDILHHFLALFNKIIFCPLKSWKKLFINRLNYLTLFPSSHSIGRRSSMLSVLWKTWTLGQQLWFLTCFLLVRNQAYCPNVQVFHNTDDIELLLPIEYPLGSSMSVDQRWCCPKITRSKPICFSSYTSLQLGLWIPYLLQCLRRPISRILLHFFVLWGDTSLHKLCLRNSDVLCGLWQEFLRGYRQQFYWSCGRRGFRIWLQGLLHIHR